MNYGDASDDEPMSKEIFKNMGGRSQSHPNVNRREECYKKRGRIEKENRNGKER